MCGTLGLVLKGLILTAPLIPTKALFGWDYIPGGHYRNLCFTDVLCHFNPIRICQVCVFPHTNFVIIPEQITYFYFFFGKLSYPLRNIISSVIADNIFSHRVSLCVLANMNYCRHSDVLPPVKEIKKKNAIAKSSKLLRLVTVISAAGNITQLHFFTQWHNIFNYICTFKKIKCDLLPIL